MPTEDKATWLSNVEFGVMGMCRIQLLIFIALSTTIAVRHESDKSVINICMDGRHHLTRPTSTRLYGWCQPWETNSCCHNSTAYELQKPLSGLYNLNLEHCKSMSDKCLESFYKMQCFYECSPNVGPWLKKDRSTIRNERLYHVPICASDCETWWNGCKGDFTCVDNFAKGFDWINQTNHCPVNSTCRSFADIFHNSTNFCEKIYPDDFKVVKDEQMCMTFDFSAHENPNAKVALDYAKKMDMSLSTVKPATVSSTGNDIIASTVGGKKYDTIQIVIPIVAAIIGIVLGLAICKTRDYLQTSKRAGTKFCPWRLKGRPPSHSLVHHKVFEDDQQFLQEDTDDVSGCPSRPHGALEIDL